MFESLAERLAGTLLMSVDAAVEFATLGEFRLVEPEVEAVDAQAPTLLVTRPARSDIPVERALLPGPSTAHARATQPSAPLPTAVSPECATRRRAAAPEQVKRTAPRKRSGSVQPPAQLCLLAD